MSKRNLILLVILLFIFALVVYVARAPKIGVVEDTPGDSNFFSDFFSNFPTFNKKNNPGDGVVDLSDDTTSEYVDEEVLALRKVSSMPVAGFGVIKKEIYSYVAEPIKTEEGEDMKNKETIPTAPTTEYQMTVRYVDKSNGNIYQSDLGKKDERKYSEAIMPGIHESFLGKNGSAVILRYLAPATETIETFIRKLPEEILGADISTDGKIDGTFLPQDTLDIALSKDKNNIFYINRTKNGVVGTVAAATGENKNQVFESPYSEWLSQWPTEDLITITTKPASGIPGYMYSINPQLKDFNKIMGGINGLTTLTSPNGKKVLFADDKIKLSILDTETGETEKVALDTLPEKCVWGKSSDVIFCGVPQFIPFGNHPDSWYKGQFSFLDNIWQISVESGETSMIVNPSKLAGESVDLIRPDLSEDENYLLFMDKKSSFLWELRLR